MTDQLPHPDAPKNSIESLQREIRTLRERLAVSSRANAGELQQQVRQLQASVGTLSAQNERLVRTLKEAREQIVNLKGEVDRLAQPPASYGLIVETHHDATADILSSGRKLRVAVSPSIEPAELVVGREVMLNEALNVVAVVGFERVGELVQVKELLGDDRVLVIAHADEERICRIAANLAGEPIRAGDSLLCDTRSGFVFERIPKAEVADLVLEEVPDIRYEEIGGLSGQSDLPMPQTACATMATAATFRPWMAADSDSQP